MPQDRSIRNIPLPPSHRPPPRGDVPSQQDYSDYENDEKGIPPPARPRTPKRHSGRGWWLLGGVVLVGAIMGLLLSTVFEGATVILTQKTALVPTPQTLQAQLNGAAGAFTYQTITATQTATTTVTANGIQHISRAASGAVTFYNTFGPDPQKLSANTRVTAPDGKIYHLRDAVTIPGVIKKSNGSLAPGTVAGVIVADKVGAAYNQNTPIQLTIVNFKGTAKYTKFLAQSQGALSGGIVGDEPAISPSDMANAQNDLKHQLDANIRSTATSQIPDGFVAVNGSLYVAYTDIAQTPGVGNTIVLQEKATASLAMIRANDLASALAATSVKDYKGEAVQFGDMTKTTISLPSNSATSTNGTLKIIIDGAPTLIWKIDAEAVKKALVGQEKSQFSSVVKGFEPSVAKAQASIRPFWKATFPADPSKVSVTVNP